VGVKLCVLGAPEIAVNVPPLEVLDSQVYMYSLETFVPPLAAVPVIAAGAEPEHTVKSEAEMDPGTNSVTFTSLDAVA
jgi:hypothetical protein